MEQGTPPPWMKKKKKLINLQWIYVYNCSIDILLKYQKSYCLTTSGGSAKMLMKYLALKSEIDKH